MNKHIKKILAFSLKTLSFLPGSWVVSMEYLYNLHRLPNLKHPQRFTEWIQWYKLNYRNTTMFECVDKYTVRSYVESHGCGQYLNTLYQVCNSASEIDYSQLPSRFVIKTTDGGNGDNVYICKDKDSINIADVNALVDSWKNKKLEDIGKEWAYTGCKGSRIIVEQYLEDPTTEDGSITDYKFLCFNGKFRYLWLDANRYSKHTKGWWNEKLEFIGNFQKKYADFETVPHLPDNIDEMIRVAEQLSSEFPFARVDFYNIQGKIYFGEITFYPTSGYAKFEPSSFDYELGKYFNSSI